MSPYHKYLANLAARQALLREHPHAITLKQWLLHYTTRHHVSRSIAYKHFKLTPLKIIRINARVLYILNPTS